MVVVDRAKAATTLTMNPFFSVSDFVFVPGFVPCALIGYPTPVECRGARASGNFSQNSAQFSSSSESEAWASTIARLSVSGDPVVISLNCATAGQGDARISDVTTGQFGFGCGSSLLFGPFSDSKSGTFLLNPGDTYEIDTHTGSFDGGDANISFQGDFTLNLVIPEPSTFCLLGIALISLSLVHKRLQKVNRTYLS
jgi:hypothetical protein